jgi:hypothetical protein
MRRHTGSLSAHEVGQSDGLYVAERQAICSHVLPTKKVAVGDVKDLVHGALVGRAEQHRSGQQIGVCDLIARTICTGLAGKPERNPSSLVMAA